MQLDSTRARCGQKSRSASRSPPCVSDSLMAVIAGTTSLVTRPLSDVISSMILNDLIVCWGVSIVIVQTGTWRWI